VRREETFSVVDHVVIDVELPAGSVLLRTGDVGRVTVSIDSSGADSFDLGQVGDNIGIRATRRGRSARIVVDAPTGTDVNVKGASVDISARGAFGALRIRSVSGEVVADDLVRADVSLASGDTRIDLVRHDATFNATSGDVAVRSVGGRLVATLTSGDLHADDVGSDVESQSASGDITIRHFGGSSATLRTVSGDIRLGLPSGIRVEPQISTLSGKVVLPQPAASTPDADRRPVRLRLNSVSGDIRIERAG